MSALLVGYARCSTDQQDLTAQRDGLLNLGVQTARQCVHVILKEEWEHLRFATRDLDVFHAGRV